MEQTEKDQHHKLMKATGVVSAATLVSRILGFLRDTVVASIFGTGMAADAFYVAFRIPNLLRQLVGEGAMSTSFIPVFTDYLHNKSEEESWKLANNALCVAFVLLLSICTLGMIFAPFVVSMVAPGFTGAGAKYELTILLTRITFPYILFITLMALMMGILNSLHHFLAPALSPVMLNVSLITTALFVAPHFDQPVIALAIGVLVGGLLQMLLQIPFLIKKGMKFSFHIDFKENGLRRIGKLLVPTAVGSAADQINAVIDTLLASFLPEGSVSYLYYSSHLVQFPLGLFGNALGTALLPTLSHQAAKGEIDKLKETFAFSLRMVMFVCLPATVGLMVLREPIVQILFEHGKFGPQATAGTASALLYYSLGLWAYAAVKIVVPVFYAQQDAKTPIKMSIICVIVNTILNIILMKFMFHSGLALATSISSVLNLFLLLIPLRKKMGKIGGRKILASSLRTSFAAICMGIVCWLALKQTNICALSGTMLKAGYLGLIIVLGGGVFLLLSHWLASDEFNFLKDLIKRKAKAA